MNSTHPDSVDSLLLHEIRLSLIPGVGPRAQQNLRNHLGNAESILSASREQLQQVPGVGPKLANSIQDSRDFEIASKELEECRDSGFSLVMKGTPEYPRLLEEVGDSPQLLYLDGEILEQDELAIGIVGARHCSPYGLQQAEKLATGLALAGVTVVSGLARGIDGAAHRAALKAGGRTIAVTATGLKTVYPPEHKELAEEISKQGAILTEFHLNQKPLPGLFPQRNRIISGLSIGVIIIEASKKSGSLHTARHAMEQGREVFAVPGRIDSPMSEGCHNLIRDGATLVRNVNDILDELGPLTEPVTINKNSSVNKKQLSNNQDSSQNEPVPEKITIHTPRELKLNDQEQLVIQAIQIDPRPIDEILREVDLDPPRVLATLTVLEMKQLIRRFPGNYVARSPNY